MFSVKEKQFIANQIERILLELNHPEMPKDKLDKIAEIIKIGIRGYIAGGMLDNDAYRDIAEKVKALLLTEDERKSIIEKTRWSNGKARFTNDIPQLDLAQELTKAQNEKMEEQK